MRWDYDRFGNRRNQNLTGGTTSITTPQLTISETTNRITTAGYVYDAVGNLTNDSLHVYTYDAENRIKTVDTTAATNTYSGAMRVKKVAGSTTTVYIFSGLKVIAEYVNGSLGKEYVYSGSMLMATHEGPTLRYHHPDHLGTRVDSDAAGNWTRKFGHFPFGESWYEDLQGGGVASKLKFTSYERDSESGLDQAMFRYDSSRLGRFMSPDLLAGNLRNPQSLNRYAYVLNDPVNFFDPLGLEQDECKWVCGKKGCTLTCPYVFPPSLFPPFGDATTGSGPNIADSLWGYLFSRGFLAFFRDTTAGLEVTNVTVAGNRVQSALDALLKRLESDPDCLKFLAGGGSAAGVMGNIQKYRSYIGQANISLDGDKRRVGAVSGGGVPQEFAMIFGTLINNTGGFFKDVPDVNPGMSYKVQGGGPAAQGFILLHELAHVLEKGVFEDDFKNPSATQRNNALLEKNCSKTLGR